MPGWLEAISKCNPLSYEVDALRGLLIGTPAHLGLDFAVLAVATVVGVATSARCCRALRASQLGCRLPMGADDP
jgi:hypothetical protein